ncbi:MAG TPA: glycosyltransferase family 9 protein [Vicinamibacterales bacterium]|nr:glycosyltransferase family 9 protein [Vicinamibacterales bacterium]
MKRILIVRMSALGDIVHALPVLPAIRAAYPHVEVDWLADDKYAGILSFVDGLAERIMGRPGLSQAVTAMRARKYDVAIDLQGLLKSASMARLSGAPRVIGFERRALRERAAAWFYSETATVPPDAHVIRKNLSVLPLLGVADTSVRFPFVIPSSAVAERVAADLAVRGTNGFALMNPGAAWPNKRWPPERFGAVARHLRDRHALPSLVLWGGGEAALADAVAQASDAAAVRAPETSLGDLLALSARASLMVSGDTGPVHLAAAMQTPIVGLYGPTWPERNGPWDPRDLVVSRAGTCECHHKRACRRGSDAMCLKEITIEHVKDAVDERLRRAAQVRA